MKVIPMTPQEIEERNLLIPIAEKYANFKFGNVCPEVKRGKKLSKLELVAEKEEWYLRWNKAYLGKMDQL